MMAEEYDKQTEAETEKWECQKKKRKKTHGEKKDKQIEEV